MIKGLSFKDVKKITDTTGFEPLDVKIKRFMLSGEMARLHSPTSHANRKSQTVKNVNVPSHRTT